MRNDYRVNEDGSTTIFLRRKTGHVVQTLIDTEDLDKVKKIASGRRWVTIKNKTGFYVFITNFGGVGKGNLWLHRVVTDCPDDMEPDHLNRQPLDNRKLNLRVGTRSENLKNRKIGVYGTCYSKVMVGSKERWRVRIRNANFKKDAWCDTEAEAVALVALFRKEYEAMFPKIYASAYEVL